MRIMYSVEVHYFYIHFIKSFFLIVLNFVKCYFWDDHIVFILHFVNIVYHVDLWMLNHLCIPGINLTWSWCMILLMHCCILFANVFGWDGDGGGLVTKSCLTLVAPWTVACQVPLSMGFSRQEYWNGLPFPSPGGEGRGLHLYSSEILAYNFPLLCYLCLVLMWR